MEEGRNQESPKCCPDLIVAMRFGVKFSRSWWVHFYELLFWHDPCAMAAIKEHFQKGLSSSSLEGIWASRHSPLERDSASLTYRDKDEPILDIQVACKVREEIPVVLTNKGLASIKLLVAISFSSPPPPPAHAIS